MKEIIFEGSGVALITPFTQDFQIDYSQLEQLIEFQIEGGTDSIIACGTTSEASTLSNEDHVAVIDFIIKKVNGRVPVIAGTGSNDTLHCVELSQEAKNLGADGLLLVTPYYNKTSQKGLLEHYGYVADHVKMPIVLYNVPGRTGLNILPETYYALSKNPYIVALKEANGNMSALARTIALCGDDLTIYSGDDNQTLPIMAMGGKGVISVLANILPKPMHDLAAAMQKGDLAQARAITAQYLDLMDGVMMDVNPIPVKEAMNQMGLPAGPCRLPLTTMTDDNLVKMTALLKKHSLI